MTAIVTYSAIAGLLIIIAVLLVLVWRGQDARPAEGQSEREYVPGPWSGASFRLSERLFDPADYFWLRDEARYPQLARDLARARKRMALRWLKMLRTSFDDLVRVPEPAPGGGQPSDALHSWEMLRLILRFYLLLGYAMLVVWLFGPYHRLLPSLDWVQGIPTPPLIASLRDARASFFPSKTQLPFRDVAKPENSSPRQRRFNSSVDYLL